MVVLKLQLDADIRRITITSAPSIQGLYDMVPMYFQKKTPPKFILKYLDDEQDLITLSSNEEVKEAFRLAQKTGFLKVKVISSKEPLDYVDDVANASQKLFTNISNEVKSVATKVHEKVSPSPSPASPPVAEAPQAQTTSPRDPNFFQDVAQALETALDTITNEVRTIVGNFKEKLSQQTQTEQPANAAEHTQTDATQSEMKTTQTEPSAPVEEEEEEEEEEFLLANVPPQPFPFSELEEKLDQLEEMGFKDQQRNIELLVKHKGNVVEVVKELLE